MTPMRWSLPALLFAACAPEADDSAAADAPPACDSPGQTYVGVVSSLTFGRADADMVSPGFDLDGVVTDQGDSSGCGIPDYTSPEGVEGVDNAFARLVPALEMTEAAAVEPLIQDAIDSGELLIMIGLSGVDDLRNDSCVDFSLFRGAGTPSMGTDGTMEWSQTFDVDLESPPVQLDDVALVDGRLMATPFDTNIPLTVLGHPLDFPVSDGIMQLDLAADGTMSGLLAGGTSVENLVSVAYTDDVDAQVSKLVEALVTTNADLDRDGDRVCEEMAVTFQIGTIPAFVFADVEETVGL
jgi:hypothetical protein